MNWMSHPPDSTSHGDRTSVTSHPYPVRASAADLSTRSDRLAWAIATLLALMVIVGISVVGFMVGSILLGVLGAVLAAALAILARALL